MNIYRLRDHTGFTSPTPMNLLLKARVESLIDFCQGIEELLLKKNSTKSKTVKLSSQVKIKESPFAMYKFCAYVIELITGGLGTPTIGTCVQLTVSGLVAM